MYFLKTWLTLTLGFACMLNLQSQSDPVYLLSMARLLK